MIQFDFFLMTWTFCTDSHNQHPTIVKYWLTYILNNMESYINTTNDKLAAFHLSAATLVLSFSSISISNSPIFKWITQCILLSWANGTEYTEHHTSLPLFTSKRYSCPSIFTVFRRFVCSYIGLVWLVPLGYFYFILHNNKTTIHE